MRGASQPACLPHDPMGPLLTHCRCRRLPLSHAPYCGSSALARAFDTAAGPALCLSSAPRSSPLLQPLLSPASTRCPKKIASITQSELRGTFGLPPMLGPVRIPPPCCAQHQPETFSDGAVYATLDPADNSHFFHVMRQKYIACGFHIPWPCSHRSPTWQPSAV